MNGTGIFCCVSSVKLPDWGIVLWLPGCAACLPQSDRCTLPPLHHCTPHPVRLLTTQKRLTTHNNHYMGAMAADRKEKSQVHKVALQGSAKTVSEFVSLACSNLLVGSILIEAV
jgi:hypothetical protein